MSTDVGSGPGAIGDVMRTTIVGTRLSSFVRIAYDGIQCERNDMRRITATATPLIE